MPTRLPEWRQGGRRAFITKILATVNYNGYDMVVVMILVKGFVIIYF